MTEEMRMFIAVDNHQTVKDWRLEHLESIPVLKLQFVADFPEAVVREGADGVTNVGDNRWRQLLLDEGWHASCQATYRGIEGEAWEKLCHNFGELHKAVNLPKLGNNHKAKALWLMRDAKTNGEAYKDRKSERQIES